ncbi:hypothetical protein [Actinoallomurus sp. NPDC052274]|uniref:hypothetical protein n=1 Tax=Actinoallomurus sp. NPDC052274 TaxID=3155420 RepID=UPI0034496536
MAARTALTPVQLVRDGGVAQGAGTAIAGLVSAGATIASPGPFRLQLIVTNSGGAAANVTVRASRNGVDAAGNAQTNKPADVVFTRATLGDLVVSVGASATQIITIDDSSRFAQDDGSVSVDFAAGMTGTIWVLRLPIVIPS